MNSTENRKNREKQFHNQRYSDDQRSVIAPIYSFAQYSKVIFENIVTNIKHKNNILEIGCGTNTLSKKISRKEQMLQLLIYQIKQSKLLNFPDTNFYYFH